MSTFAIIAICYSTFSITFSILITLYSLRIANLKKPHVKLILVSQICNITLQSGELISFIYYLSDPSNLQNQTILAAFQNYVSAVNLFMAGLFLIKILSIFSVYDLRLTESRMTAFKRGWHISAAISLLPLIIFFTYLAFIAKDNEDPEYMMYTVVIVMMSWIFVAISMIMGNVIAIYLMYLVLGRNNKIEAQQKGLTTRLVLLNVFSVLLEWGIGTMYLYFFVFYTTDSLIITTANKISTSTFGSHASISIVIFYGLQEIALSKATKRRKAEKERQKNAQNLELANINLKPQPAVFSGTQSNLTTVTL
jgi:hypothetical protein